MAGHKHRHMELVKNPKVRDWYKDNTESTAKNYVRTLGRFCEKTKTKPLSLLKMSGQALVDIWRDYAGTMQDKHGLRPAGATAKKALVSWLTFNGREQQAFAMSKRAKTGGSSTPRREFSSLPTQAKLAAALNVAKPKVQAEMAFMAFAGQRIEVMGMREKDDGLRLSDFPEAELRDGQFQFRKEPTYFRVRSEISKTREWYFAFLGPEGCRLVANYINTRLGAGEHVTMNSPVIAPDAVRRRGQSKVGNRVEFIHPNNIGDAIRACLRNVGIKVRPYDLRHYFSQNSELAQGLNTDWKEFWMGHVKDVKAKYALRDPTQLIEQMRENYRKILPYIET